MRRCFFGGRGTLPTAWLMIEPNYGGLGSSTSSRGDGQHTKWSACWLLGILITRLIKTLSSPGTTETFFVLMRSKSRPWRRGNSANTVARRNKHVSVYIISVHTGKQPNSWHWWCHHLGQQSESSLSCPTTSTRSRLVHCVTKSFFHFSFRTTNVEWIGVCSDIMFKFVLHNDVGIEFV